MWIVTDMPPAKSALLCCLHSRQTLLHCWDFHQKLLCSPGPTGEQVADPQYHNFLQISQAKPAKLPRWSARNPKAPSR